MVKIVPRREIEITLRPDYLNLALSSSVSRGSDCASRAIFEDVCDREVYSTIVGTFD